MKIRIRIKFFLHHRRPDQTQGLALRMRVTLAGQRPFDIATGWNLDTDFWDDAAQEAIGAAADINRTIAEYRRAVDEACARFDLVEKREPTSAELRAEINKILGRKSITPSKEQATLRATCASFIKHQSSAREWATNTKDNVSVACVALCKYDGEVLLSNITAQWVDTFTSWMAGRGRRATSTREYIVVLRSVLKWASENGQSVGDALKYHPRQKGARGGLGEIIYLSPEELSRLAALEFRPVQKQLEEARDVLLFTCFSGLRYSDVEKLRKSDVKGDYFSVVTQKTSDPLHINLNTATREILAKYQTLSGEQALPVPSNRIYGERLKKIAKQAGIDTPVTDVFFVGGKRVEKTTPKYERLSSHVGRRTFVVNALRMGIPAEVIMRWTGHKNYEAMRPYVKIVDELKREAMQRFDTMAGEIMGHDSGHDFCAE